MIHTRRIEELLVDDIIVFAGPGDCQQWIVREFTLQHASKSWRLLVSPIDDPERIEATFIPPLCRVVLVAPIPARNRGGQTLEDGAVTSEP